MRCAMLAGKRKIGYHKQENKKDRERALMTLEILKPRFSICKLPPEAMVPAAMGTFVFCSRTDRELSIVCEEGCEPAGGQIAAGWRALRVEGTLAFSLVGVLAELAGLLAAHRVGIFVVSTFDTDYILVREGQLSDAVEALETGGHIVFEKEA